jgi:hypothetical protein
VQQKTREWRWRGAHVVSIFETVHVMSALSCAGGAVRESPMHRVQRVLTLGSKNSGLCACSYPGFVWTTRERVHPQPPQALSVWRHAMTPQAKDERVESRDLQRAGL